MTWLDFYTRLAWQNGDPALQAGWWHYIAAELDKLEQAEPGIKAKVIAACAERRANDRKETATR